MCIIVNMNEYRKNQDSASTEVDWLRTELFFDQAEALFKPVGLFIQTQLKERHGLVCEFSYVFGDGEYFADPLKCWTYGFLTVTAEDGKVWMVCCSVDGRFNNQKCSFYGDTCDVEEVVLEDELERICSALLEDAQTQLLQAKK